MWVHISKVVFIFIILSASMEVFSYNTDHLVSSEIVSRENVVLVPRVNYSPEILGEACIQLAQAQQGKMGAHRECHICPCCSVAMPSFSNLVSQ